MPFKSDNSIWNDLNVAIVWKLIEVDAPITNWVIAIELLNYIYYIHLIHLLERNKRVFIPVRSINLFEQVDNKIHTETKTE